MKLLRNHHFNKSVAHCCPAKTFQIPTQEGSSSYRPSKDKERSSWERKSKSMSGSGAMSGESVVEPEVFLRNPKTGGFDCTPSQQSFQSLYRKKKKQMEVDTILGETVLQFADMDDEVTTLNDSTIYTSNSRRLLLPKKHSTRSTEEVNHDTEKKHKNALQSLLSKKYFHTSTSKAAPTKPPPDTGLALYSPPEGVLVTPPSKSKNKSLLTKLKCRVTKSSPEAGERIDEANARRSNPSETSSTSSHQIQYIHPQVEAARRIMNSPSRRHGTATPRAEAMLITPPRSGRSPRQVMSPPTIDSEDDDQSSFARLVANRNRDAHAFCAASLSYSSCLDFSFSTLGGSRHKDESLGWTFEAVSPVTCCGSKTNDAAESVEVCMKLNDSYEGDNEQEEDESPTVLFDRHDATALDILPQDALSLASAGALLLTEEGLKRHNDKKLQQEGPIEPLTLKQANGVGKLERQVLQQKVQRLQAKEVKKQAETSLEQERAARKRRHMKAKQQQVVFVADTGGSVTTEDATREPREETTPPKRSSPPRRVLSTSPQTSATQSPSPVKTPPLIKRRSSSSTTTTTTNNKQKSFLSKVLLPWGKNKKPTAEELKRQWKERERQRARQARQEKMEAEQRERERIEELRQSYLEKQRQLEQAASVSRVIIDVDELIEANQYRRLSDETTQVQGPSSPLDQYFVNAQSLPDLGSLTTTTMTPTLGPCTVCQHRERTHIAMPCMHFAFCGDCVQNQTMCPMCTMENVTFSRVNTE